MSMARSTPVALIPNNPAFVRLGPGFTESPDQSIEPADVRSYGVIRGRKERLAVCDNP